jgi:branched-chain amino acid transport system substrate-binding protein
MRTSERGQDGDGAGGGLRRAAGRLARIAAAGVVTLVAGASGGACSLIVDTNADQCQALSDCNGFAGFRACTSGVCVAQSSVPTCASDTDCAKYAQSTCNTAAGVCTRPCSQSSDCGDASLGLSCNSGQCTGGTSGGNCTKNADCSATMGQDYICRNSKCVTYKLNVGGTNLCQTLYASKSPAATAYQDDTAVIFGDILPTAANSDGPYGHLVEDSIKLALDDFSKADGLPGLGSNPNRPIVLIGCNDGVNEDQTDVVAKHLINDLAVPAIIGYAFSGSTISVAQDVTIPDNVLLFSPSATSVAITDLENANKTKGLLWRDCPNDDVQASAQLLLFPGVVAAAEAKYPMIDQNNVKVAIVNHMDAYGSGLGDVIESKIMFNGMGAVAQMGTNYLRVDYGMSTNPNLNVIPTITSFAPDVIFLFGFNEGPDQIFTAVESQWTVPADGHRPFWIMSDGDQVTSLWATHPDPTIMNQMDPADISTEDQRERVIGTVPGTNPSSWPNYGTFLSHFAGTYGIADGSADTIGPAGAYDILYLLAYSTVMLGNKPLTGPNLVTYGLDKINPMSGGGSPVTIGSQGILTTIPLLTGAPINIQGASGPLAFDHKGDLITADIQIWCVPPAAMGGKDVGAPATNSGYYFDSKSSKLTGCISKTCNLPGYTSDCP